MTSTSNISTSSISITINGTPYNIDTDTNIGQVLTLLKSNNGLSSLAPTDFVIALNQTFIPRSQYDNTQLQNNDAIELLSPMAGG